MTYLMTIDQAATPKRKRAYRYGPCVGECARPVVRIHAKARCKTCYDHYRRQGLEPAWTPAPIDPCPDCGVPSIGHWRCQGCGSRGHMTGHARHDETLCAWCETERARLARCGPRWQCKRCCCGESTSPRSDVLEDYCAGCVGDARRVLNRCK